MGRTCTICTNDNRHGIETALSQQESYRRIAARFGVTTSALQRHKRDHLQENSTVPKTVPESRMLRDANISRPSRARAREQGAAVPHTARLPTGSAQAALEGQVRNLKQQLADAQQRLAEHKRYHEAPQPDKEAYTRERLAAVERQQAEQDRFLQQQWQEQEERYAALERAGLVVPRDEYHPEANRKSVYLGERR